jgi:NAD(P)H dehydrogenase (quinone)
MGSIYSAAGEGKTAYITREDCARAAAAALAAPFEGTRILNITGSQALSPAEIAGIASGITGKSLSYTFVPLEAVIQGMVGAGLPQPLAETFASIDSAIAAGKLAEVSGAFEELTGHTPTSAVDFLKAHEAALVEAITAQ